MPNLRLDYSIEANKLKDNYININNKIKININGKVVCITGSHPTMNRENFQAWLKIKGATVITDINLSTDYLICGKSTSQTLSSKIKKALKYGVQTLLIEDILE